MHIKDGGPRCAVDTGHARTVFPIDPVFASEPLHWLSVAQLAQLASTSAITLGSSMDTAFVETGPIDSSLLIRVFCTVPPQELVENFRCRKGGDFEGSMQL
jgi:hypothetical protein